MTFGLAAMVVSLGLAAEPPPLVGAHPELPSAPPSAPDDTPLPVESAGARTLTFPQGVQTVPWYEVKLDWRDSEGGAFASRAARDLAWGRVRCPAPTVAAHLAVYDRIDMSFSAESFGPDGSHTSFAETQLVFAAPEAFPVLPRAQRQLYSYRESQLPVGSAAAFRRGGLYVFCLSSEPVAQNGAARASLSESGSEILAILEVELGFDLRFAIASALYRPAEDAIQRFVRWPDRPHADVVQRAEGGGVVVSFGAAAPVPCDSTLGDRIAYVFAEMVWTPYKAGPRSPRLGPGYGIEITGPKGTRTLRIQDDDGYWYARGLDGGWMRTPSPVSIMSEVDSQMYACRPNGGLPA